MGDLADFLLPNAPTCIVACSAADARLWRSTSRYGDWQLITSLSNPSAGMSEAEFASDRPGRAFDSRGAGRHAMASPESGQQHEVAQFAAQLADLLNRSIAKGDFDHIVLIGAPRFLGYLRSELSDSAQRAIIVQASKNLTDFDAAVIKKYFE